MIQGTKIQPHFRFRYTAQTQQKDTTFKAPITLSQPLEDETFTTSLCEEMTWGQ